MKNLLTGSASDFLKTRFGTVLILSVIVISMVSNWLFFKGTLGTSFSDLCLYLGASSFFISWILIIIRFQTISDRVFDVIFLVWNILSWWWIIYAINNPSDGGAAVALIFIVSQFYTVKRSYNFVRWLILKTAKEK